MFGGGAFGSGGGAGGAAAAGAFGGGGGVADSGLTEDGLKAHFEARERRLRGEPENAGDGDSSVLAADKLLGLSDDSGRDTMNRSLRQAVLDESDHGGGNAEDENEEWRGASKRRAAAAAAAGVAGAGGDGNLVAESLGVQSEEAIRKAAAAAADAAQAARAAIANAGATEASGLSAEVLERNIASLLA